MKKTVLFSIITIFWAVMVILFLRWEIFPPPDPGVNIEELIGHKMQKEKRVWGIFLKNDRIGSSISIIDPSDSDLIKYSSFYELNFFGTQQMKAAITIEIGGSENARLIEKISGTFEAGILNKRIQNGSFTGTPSGKQLHVELFGIVDGNPMSISHDIDNFNNSKILEMMYTPVIPKRKLRVGEEWQSQSFDPSSLLVPGMGGNTNTTITQKVVDISTFTWNNKKVDVFVVHIFNENKNLLAVAKVNADGEVLEQQIFLSKIKIEVEDEESQEKKIENVNKVILRLETLEIGDDNKDKIQENK